MVAALIVVNQVLFILYVTINPHIIGEMYGVTHLSINDRLLKYTGTGCSKTGNMPLLSLQ